MKSHNDIQNGSERKCMLSKKKILKNSKARTNTLGIYILNQSLSELNYQAIAKSSSIKNKHANL